MSREAEIQILILYREGKVCSGLCDNKFGIKELRTNLLSGEILKCIWCTIGISHSRLLNLYYNYKITLSPALNFIQQTPSISL